MELSLVPASLVSEGIFVLICAVVLVAIGSFYVRSGGSVSRWTAILILWAVVTAVIPTTGLLHTKLPIGVYAFGPFILISSLGPIGLAASAATKRLLASGPIAALVGFQAFRLPLELVLHSWWEQGTLPVQMTYSGYNFDILSGVAGLVVGLVLWKGDLGPGATRALVFAFNLLGSVLLAVVVGIAFASAPGAQRVLHEGPAVVLVLYLPYTWIVTICVAGAAWGHLVLWRWLLQRESGEGL